MHPGTVHEPMRQAPSNTRLRRSSNNPESIRTLHQDTGAGRIRGAAAEAEAHMRLVDRSRSCHRNMSCRTRLQNCRTGWRGSDRWRGTGHSREQVYVSVPGLLKMRAEGARFGYRLVHLNLVSWSNLANPWLHLRWARYSRKLGPEIDPAADSGLSLYLY